MLPKRKSTPELRAIADELRASSANVLVSCPPLLEQDILRIGACILSAAAIELHLRLAVEIFARSGHLDEEAASKADRIHSSELVETVCAAAVRSAGGVGERDLYRRRFAEIESCRAMRNLFAHSAARRVTGRDAVMFIIKSEKDAELILGRPTGEDHALSAVITDAALVDLRSEMTDHEAWIAQQVSFWHTMLL